MNVLLPTPTDLDLTETPFAHHAALSIMSTAKILPTYAKLLILFYYWSQIWHNKPSGSYEGFYKEGWSHVATTGRFCHTYLALPCCS